jgi:hypothetical protein
MAPTARPSKKEEFFGLNRPEYLPAPEVILSSLIWSEALNGASGLGGEFDDGIIYKRSSSANVSSKVFEVFSETHHGRWNSAEDIIGEHFDLDPKYSKKALHIFSEDLVGTVAAKSKAKPIVPITLLAALFQDMQGLTSKKNPFNVAALVQRIFEIGGGQGSLSEKIVRTMNKKGNDFTGGEIVDRILSEIAPEEINDAYSKLLLKIDLAPNSSDSDSLSSRVGPMWLQDVDTPFKWFAENVQALVSNDWIGMMPRRRWVDWLLCVFRTAIGATFLFEMNFYYQILLGIQASSGADADILVVKERALGLVQKPMVWNAEESVSSRDIAGRMKKTIQRGASSRALIVEFIKEGMASPSEYESDPDGLEKWIESARAWLSLNKSGNEKTRKEIDSAIAGGTTRSSNNVLEIVRYALQDRSGPSSRDYYSLTKKIGSRFTVVEPGEEWLVVVGSLSALSPGHATRVGDLIRQIRSLGIDTNYATITEELEKIGMAKTSHDADDALEVMSAF